MTRIIASVLPSLGDAADFEIVERKGAGHPDTLADGLAEAVSAAYSRYSLELCGAILHHNADKSVLLGGSARVDFGGGEITSPIEALVNGRFSTRLGNVEVPVFELVEATTRRFLAEKLPLLDVSRDLVVRLRSSQAASPGAVGGNGNSPRSRWFAPERVEDLRDLSRPFANDTSVGVGFAPLSTVERLALGIEQAIAARSDGVPYGSDTKVMICRSGRECTITLAIPQLAHATTNLAEYVERREFAGQLVRD